VGSLTVQPPDWQGQSIEFELARWNLSLQFIEIMPRTRTNLTSYEHRRFDLPLPYFALMACMLLAATTLHAKSGEWDFTREGLDLPALKTDGWVFSLASQVEISTEKGLLLSDDGPGQPTAELPLNGQSSGRVVVDSLASGTTDIHGKVGLVGADGRFLAGISYRRSNSISSMAKGGPVNAETDGGLVKLAGPGADIFRPSPTNETPGTLEIEWKEDLTYHLVFRVGNFDIYEESGELAESPVALKLTAGFNSATDRHLQVYSVKLIAE